ncbi:hypothetical protein HZC09_04110 [Candidatus Micrarchaeota archaeon]|nr:hypothetical protein [Candidatus Micrarchaeota archaeon]
MLNTFKQYYFEDTGRANERHKIVASTLRKLAERYGDGDAVVVFGAEHSGMDEYIRKQMEKHGIKAQVMTTEKEVLEPTIYWELAEKRQKDPTFKPADDELAKAFLHDIVSAFIAKNIRKKMGWKKGDTDHNLRLFRYKEYRDAMQRTGDTIKMLNHTEAREQIERFAKDGKYIEKFLEECSGRDR